MAVRIHPILKIPPRILIVDNDSRTCESLYELLSHWEYDVVIAEGDGEELLKDAQEKASEFCCHVAIVDIRLIDDFDREDKSGLDLVKKLKPTVSVVMSGYGDDQTASESLEEKGAVSFFGKQWAPEVLRQKLEKVVHSICANKRNLKIEPVQVIDEVTKMLLKDVEDRFHDQFTDVLARLFPNAHHLRIEKLGKEELSDFSTAPRPTSVILKVYEKLADEELQPVIVKLARAEKIKKEVSAYKNFVWRRLVGLYNANLEDSVVLWDIGGAIYSYFGNISVKPFYQYSKSENLDNIGNCLRNFFSSTWSEHYRKAKEKADVSLFEIYCEVWGTKWYGRAMELKEFDPAIIMGKEMWEKIHPLHPIDWLLHKIEDNLKDDFSRVDKTYIAVTHGDLHGDNLLVDENHNAWVIDFERCKEGHILQDFIELETDIINRINTNRENLQSFYQLCLAVTTPKYIRRIPVDGVGLSDPDVRKSLEIVSMIRALAYETTGVSDAREYLFGLLFNSIFRATIIPKDNLSHSQHRALMLASIICHRLDHWNEPWPPEEWWELL